MNTYGWEQLNCPYFKDTTREILADYLANLGFSEKRITNGGGVVYSNIDVFIEVGYDTNLFPNYSTRVVIGFGDGAYDELGAFSGIPMWYIIPKNHPYRTKVYWTFASKEELLKILVEVKQEFLETTVVPLLQNHQKLSTIIDNFQSEFCS